MRPILGVLAGAVGLLGAGAAVAHFVPITIEEKNLKGYTVRVRTAGISLEDKSMLFSVEVRKPVPDGMPPAPFKPLMKGGLRGEVRLFTKPTLAMAAGLEAVLVEQQGLDLGSEGINVRLSAQRAGSKNATFDASALGKP